MFLSALKQKINIKYFMVGYVGFLLFFSSLALNQSQRLWKGLAVVIFYTLFDLLWTRLRDKIWYLPVSSWISGFILSVVAIPAPSLPVLILLPLLAVFSKQVLHFRKMRHVFNPAAFAMAILAFFTPAVSWWGVAWGKPVLAIVILVGLFILWRQERWHVTIPFLIAYAFFLGLLFLSKGIPINKLLGFLRPQIIDGTTIFFATVMLIEPLTSTFPTKNNRIFYGASVGFLAVLVTYLGSFIPLKDPLIYGLLFGNLLASLLFLPSQKPVAVPLAQPPISEEADSKTL